MTDNQNKIDMNDHYIRHNTLKAFIRFFIFEEKKVVDGHYSYRQFIEFAKQKGATQFDAERLRVPEISKEEIMEFVNSVSQE